MHEDSSTVTYSAAPTIFWEGEVQKGDPTWVHPPGLGGSPATPWPATAPERPASLGSSFIPRKGTA